MGNKWIGLLYFIILRQLNTTAFNEIKNHLNGKSEKRSLVEVRAVFINCELEGSVPPDSDSMRFEREELYKHSILRDCRKKIAVTVKIVSEPEQHSGDEYLPIEHVLEGSNKKRVRLLDPYILRLRRELPLQAYKLRRVDTITGILLDNEIQTLDVNANKNVKSRIERDVQQYEKEAWRPDHEVLYPQTDPMTPHGIQTRSNVDEHSDMCTNTINVTINKRNKRSEHNIVVEEVSDDNKQWNSKDQYYRISEQEREPAMTGDIFDERPVINNHQRPVIILQETSEIPVTKAQSDERNYQKKKLHSKFFYSNDIDSKPGRNKFAEKHKINSPAPKMKESKSYSSTIRKHFDEGMVAESEDYNVFARGEDQRDYAVYKIGQPELWYTVHVQLFEKLSTPDGKTVWNDLTKGEQASVSSTAPEWTGQDLNVRYRPAEWIPRKEFSLPASNLCLLAPIRAADGGYVPYNENNTFSNESEDGGYIVIPEEDVMGIKDEDANVNKRSDNISESEFIVKSDDHIEREGRRRVVFRSSRALLSGEEKVNIAFRGSDKYLTLPHRHPHHAQIDIEARADENELVRVGASGRVAVAVADSTRRTRTIITLQIGNTGLAAARFRVITRECGPALSDLMNEKNKPLTMAGPVLIPPRHTRTLKLELPLEIPVDVIHCSVSLLNDEDKSIAVRDVAIKKGDRCFCVWHCDCVCLTDDPKLLCHEMVEARQSAAGLSSRDRTRHARSACYQDVVTLNVFIIFGGVIMALLLLGCLKAILGLLFSCIGSWGLNLIVQMPRKIDHYYERSLKCRPVEYDCSGYVIHPDTKERSVRFISRSMEFMLNVIFFLSVPCIIICNAIKQMFSYCKPSNTPACRMTSTKCNSKKCFSSQDMQGMALRWRRRRGGLRRWMTPDAQELSKELWKDSLSPPIKCEIMRPLLRDPRHESPVSPDPLDNEHEHDSCGDSEQDDTEYVLTQMQKSRESLSILKQKSKT